MDLSSRHRGCKWMSIYTVRCASAGTEEPDGWFRSDNLVGRSGMALLRRSGGQCNHEPTYCWIDPLQAGSRNALFLVAV
jgi:hypothetical protein